MLAIFVAMAGKAGYVTGAGVEDALLSILQGKRDSRGPHFANARDVRNIFEAMIGAQANRIAQMPTPGRSDLQMLTIDDLRAANSTDAVA